MGRFIQICPYFIEQLLTLAPISPTIFKAVNEPVDIEFLVDENGQVIEGVIKTLTGTLALVKAASKNQD